MELNREAYAKGRERGRIRVCRVRIEGQVDKPRLVHGSMLGLAPGAGERLCRAEGDSPLGIAP